MLNLSGTYADLKSLDDIQIRFAERVEQILDLTETGFLPISTEEAIAELKAERALMVDAYERRLREES